MAQAKAEEKKDDDTKASEIPEFVLKASDSPAGSTRPPSTAGSTSDSPPTSKVSDSPPSSKAVAADLTADLEAAADAPVG